MGPLVHFSAPSAPVEVLMTRVFLAHFSSTEQDLELLKPQ